jgi:hypothetical protein
MQARFFKLLPSIAIACIIGGCTQPAVAPKAPSFQASENTVRDWNTVAGRIADLMSERGYLAPPVVPNVPTPPTHASYGAFFVNVVAPGSTFLHEVRAGLQTEILARGGTVSRSPADAVVVNLDVDVVHWGARTTWPGGLGTVSGLASGAAILVAEGGPYSSPALFGITAGTGIAADAILSMVPNTNVEAVWEASILRGGEVLMDVHEPVYVGPYDARLYESATRFGAMDSFASRVENVPVRLRYAP